MNQWRIFILVCGLLVASCGEKSEVFEGPEVFGVPCLESAGSVNANLEAVLPPGLQELDLGMTRDDVAKARASHYQEEESSVSGPNNSMIELHQFDLQSQSSSLPIDRVELGFDRETNLLASIWARSEYGKAAPEHFKQLVTGVVEVYGEPKKMVRVEDKDIYALLWTAEQTGSGIKVMLRKSENFRPTIDFYAQTKGDLTESDSGLNRWISSGDAVSGMTALEFAGEFVEKYFGQE